MSDHPLAEVFKATADVFKHAGMVMDTLPKVTDLLLRLQEDLPSLMHKWDPHPSAADWVCCFCDQRPLVNDGDIKHHKTCLGKQIEKTLVEVDIFDFVPNKEGAE